MTRTLVFLLLLSTGLLCAQNNKILGTVKLQSSGRTPLPNVEVYALGAETAYTNDKGLFELEFNYKKAGDVIDAIEASLDGYVLINEDKCRGVAIPNDPTQAPLRIIMSKKEAFREQKARYYGIIIENAEEAYTK